MNCKAFLQGQTLLKERLTLSNQPWVTWSKSFRDCPSRLMIEVYLILRIEANVIVHQLIFLHRRLHIHHINHHHITHQLIFLHHLHRMHHNNHHHIIHQLIFLNHHYYTPLHPLTNLQLVLSKDCSAIKRPSILRSDIKSFIQGVRSRTRYTTSSLTMKAA